MTSTTRLAAALAYAARGWYVFPVIPGDKRPAFPARCTAGRCHRRDPRCRAAGRHVGWEERATTDSDRIRRCWTRTEYNIGIACGPSGLVVVDLDRLKPGTTMPGEWAGHTTGATVLAELAHQAGVQVPATYTVRTWSGGRHLYYTTPTGVQLRNTAKKLGPLVDTRAHGGFVVAAGSVVGHRPYTVDDDRATVPLPAWLTDALTPPPPPPPVPVTVRTRGSDRRGRYVHAAVTRQLDHLTRAPEGQRNHTLYLSAVALGQLAAGGAISHAEVEGLLTQTALTVGLRPTETARTIASGLRAGAKRPRTVNP